MSFKIIIFNLILIAVLVNECVPADWPMWRYDAGRTAASPENLSDRLNMHWVQHFSARQSVWDDPLNQDLMQYDRIFEPIVLGNTVFIGFNDCDKVAAFDLQTGQHKWEFYTDGPVRLPLAGRKNKIYFCSDDGNLYCLSAENGHLLWKFEGSPTNQKVLGNKRLISMWPARGGVVFKDGIIYFANSIWPMMGTFIYALDAENGDVIWRNEETGANFIKQPHGYPAFAGIAPQGAFVISGNDLLIPGGRSVPACFNRTNGKMRYYHLAKFGKTGGSFVCAMDTVFFNHDRDRMTNLYNLNNGELIARRPGKYPVITKEIYYFSGSTISARSATNSGEDLWEAEIDASGDLIMAGDFLYAGGKNVITKLRSSNDNRKPQKIWQLKVDGQVSRLIAANDYLLAVTDDGKIMAFGKEKLTITQLYNQTENWFPSNELNQKVNNLLSRAAKSEGYGLIFGIGNGDLIAALALNSNLSLIGVDLDVNKIDELRRRFDNMGLYGQRISLFPGSISNVRLPQYFSSLTIVEDDISLLMNKEIFEKLIWSARPYDGKIWIPGDEKQREDLMTIISQHDSNETDIEMFEEGLLLTRVGPLPGSDDWTHQYGDVQNSVKSDDKRVKMPLGLLWFGGNSNLDVLPRHGHGPPEQVVDGRLIIEGMNGISARDVYTGQVLWKTPLDCLETFKMYYNESYSNTPLVATYNQRHIPGANGRGTNYVVSHDFIYIIQGTNCQVLDVKTGDVIKIFNLPPIQENTNPDWGFIGLYKNYLIAGSEFANYSDLTPLSAEEKKGINQLSLKEFTDLRDKTNYDLTASKRMIIMDRYSGEVIWQIESRHGFIHNSIVSFGGILYCLDKIPAFIEGKMDRRGIDLPTNYRLLSLDIQNGNVIWEKNDKVFGSWLGYSKENNLLLQATRPSRDMLSGEEGTRMIIYKAESGEEIWDKLVSYNNPPILHNDQIITDHIALDIFSGEQIQRKNPISLEMLPWTYTTSYGCNYNIASENLLLFRTSAAGFFDLKNDGGVGHFGGFKSGCTSNLVAANGVLNAPDYTRTCQCSYQNQTSLALVHMPGVEYWTTSDLSWDGSPVKKVGLNLNAPGDRMAENGILWLDYPSIGGPSPDIPVKIIADQLTYIRRHSSFLPNCKILPWVSASAIAGLQSLEITLSKETMPVATYAIRFYFMELEPIAKGERIVNVEVQGKQVFKNFDIIKEAGGVERDIVKTIEGVRVKEKLIIRFIPSKSAPNSNAILSGIEIISDDLDIRAIGKMQ
jgi:outer membrane protein assembly factor BamB